jgi:selenocysteine lyase/cysteine desulfurase
MTMEDAALEALVAREFSALGGVTYLDHALRGPVPRRAVEAAARALELCARGAVARDELALLVEQARENVARVLGASPDEIAFVQNATAATATIAQGIRWNRRDRIVTNAGEYASNVLPWKALEDRGLRVEVLPFRDDGRLDLLDVQQAVAGARVLTVAAVSIKTGERRDLARLGALARAAGAYFVVDAAQAAGVLALDVRALGVDFLVASSRKFLLGPPEVGILYVRRERLDDLAVVAGGAGSRLDLFAPATDSRWRPDARRFEGGAIAAPLLAGLAASTGLLLELGMQEVERRALASAAVLAPHSSREAAGSPIVRVSPHRPVTERDLLAEGIVARVERSGAVRMSPHFWSGTRDLERVHALIGES